MVKRLEASKETTCVPKEREGKVHNHGLKYRDTENQEEVQKKEQKESINSRRTREGFRKKENKRGQLFLLL